MVWFDFIIIGIIAALGLFGFWCGFIQSIGSLLGTVIGVLFAFRDYQHIAHWVTSHTSFTPSNWLNVSVFILLFVVTSHAVGLVFRLINKIFDIFTALPIINTLNNVLGFLLGVFQGIVLVSATLYFISRFPLQPIIMEAIEKSQLVPFFDGFAFILLPLIPSAIKNIQSTINNLF